MVATPRTGSRSIKDAILAASPPGVKASRLHHDFPHNVKNAATRNGYEVWAVIREPMSQLKSWISHANHWHDPTGFIKTYKSRYFFYEGGMNIYNRVTDRFFIYEKGLQQVLDALELDSQLPAIGKTGSKSRELNEEQKELAHARFSKDIELYNRIWEEQDD